MGQITATVITSWITFGSLLHGKTSPGNLPLPTSTDMCPVQPGRVENATFNLSTTPYTQDFDFATTAATGLEADVR